MVERNEGITRGQAPESATTAPVLSFGTRLWKLFFDPRKTFGGIRANHEWIILWLLTAAISIGAYLPIKSIVVDTQMAQVVEQLDKTDLPEERREEILESVEGRFENPLYLLFVPGSQLILLLFVSGFLLFIGNILLGGTTSYLKMLNAYAWTMLVVIPGSLITVPLVMAKGSMDVSIGLGVLTSPETGAFVTQFLSSFELFGLWQVWLSSVAVAVLAGVETGKAFWAVFGTWLVWVLAQSGLATIGVKFGGM